MTKSSIGFLTVLSFTVLAPAMAQADVYIFAGSGLGNGGTQSLIINGSQTIQAANTGWYDSSGGHAANNTSYLAGTFGSTSYHDYFVFDLADLTGPVTSAILSIYMPTPLGYVNTSSSNSVTYENWDVSTLPSSLESTQSGALSTFNDLSSGTIFASTTVGFSNQGQQIQITLDAAAVSAIETSEGSQFAIGGVAFASAAAAPEPSTWAMVILGFVGLGFMADRRRKMMIRVA